MIDRSSRSTVFAKTRPRVLIADDDMAIRRLVTRVLGDLGCTVVDAGDAASATELLMSGDRFALALVDLRLASASGADLVRAVRAALGDRAPPFIIFSGDDPPVPLPEGVVEYVAKPASVEVLKAAAKRAILPSRRRGSGERLRAAGAPGPPASASAPPARPSSMPPSVGSATRTKPALRTKRSLGAVAGEPVRASARDRRRER